MLSARRAPNADAQVQHRVPLGILERLHRQWWADQHFSRVPVDLKLVAEQGSRPSQSTVTYHRGGSQMSPTSSSTVRLGEREQDVHPFDRCLASRPRAPTPPGRGPPRHQADRARCTAALPQRSNAPVLALQRQGTRHDAHSGLDRGLYDEGVPAHSRGHTHSTSAPSESYVYAVRRISPRHRLTRFPAGADRRQACRPRQTVRS